MGIEYFRELLQCLDLCQEYRDQPTTLVQELSQRNIPVYICVPKGKIMSQFPGTKEIAEGNIVLDCCLLEPNRGGILYRFSSRNFPSNILTKRILTLRELKKIPPSYFLPLAVIQKKVTKMNRLIQSDHLHMRTQCISAESHLTFK